MATQVIGGLVSSLRVNLRMKVPNLLGVRMRVAGVLVRTAAFVLGGKLEIELVPELNTKITHEDGTVISEETTRL